jgi:hypothetical protein
MSRPKHSTEFEGKSSSYHLDRIDCVGTLNEGAQIESDQVKISFKLVMHALVHMRLLL